MDSIEKIKDRYSLWSGFYILVSRLLSAPLIAVISYMIYYSYVSGKFNKTFFFEVLVLIILMTCVIKLIVLNLKKTLDSCPK